MHFVFQVPVVLVGNKCDKKDERQVSTADGKAMAKRYNNCFFVETRYAIVVS